MRCVGTIWSDEFPDTQLAGAHLDRAGAVMPDFEEDLAGVVEPENGVATEQLLPATELGQHRGVDRLAVERLLVWDPGVGKAGALGVMGIPFHGEEHLQPRNPLEADTPTR